MSQQPKKVAYIVSRFPAASETFVVRELNAVAADDRITLELMSLFASEDDFVHPSAERWMPKLRRPSFGEAVAGSLSWLVRRPARLLASVAAIVVATWRRPRLLARSLATVPLAAAHARTVAQSGIEHVHAHFASYPTLAAWLCGRLCDVPYSFTAHAYDIFVDQAMLERKVSDAEFVVAISRYNRSFLTRVAPDASTPIHVVHCGVDPAAYRFRPRSVPTSGPVQALCVASLQEKKGHAVLFDALAGDRPQLERLSVLLVGGGGLRGELQMRADRLGLADRIEFLGPQSEREVSDLLDASDLFVLPSIVASDGQMEGLPVALIEALACGLPVVSTNLSGIPELVHDGVTGYLSKPGDAASLAAALGRALAGQPLNPAAGREIVEREFDVRESGAYMARLLLQADDSGSS